MFGNLFHKFSPVVLVAIVTALTATLPTQAHAPAQAEPDGGLMFIENVGQFDESIRFQLFGGQSTVRLTDEAIWFTFLQEAAAKDPTTEPGLTEPAQSGVNLKVTFAEANPQPRLEPFNRLDRHISSFAGPDGASWYTDIPVWGGVRYMDLYPGIDLELTGVHGQLTPRFVIHAGQVAAAGTGLTIAETLQTIRLHVEGATAIATDSAGRLDLSTAIGDVSLPLFQIESADQVPLDLPPLQPTVSGNDVTTPFAPGSESAAGVSAAASSDLLYSTFLGGAGSVDTGVAIAVDAAGSAYVTGLAYPDFPTTPGAFDPTIDGIYPEAFVAKLDPDGTDLIYATFLGGSDYDVGQAIAVDENGSAYVAGYTSSADFPTTPAAIDRTLAGRSDAFVVKLNDFGTELIYATLLGGSDIDFGWGMALDESRQLYLTGYSQSGDFPTTPGAYDTTTNSGDAYVAKFNVDGTTLVYATLLGGSWADFGYDVAVDGAGNAYVTGYTASSDFPTTPAAIDTSQEDAEVFVAELDATGSDLLYGSYLGGSQYDAAQAIAVDEAGYVYLTGFTESGDFSTTPDSFAPVCAGCDGGYPHLDAFVAKVDPAAGELIYSSFLGGSQPDFGYGLAVGRDGSAYVTGYTSSPDFPTTPNAFDPVCDGCADDYDTDAFMVRVDPTGAELAYATVLGSAEGYDYGYDLALDQAGHIYLTGNTSSDDFPTTSEAFDATLAGFSDVFVAKLSEGEGAPSIPVQTCAPTPLGTIAVGEMPRGLALDPARNRLYVANFGGGSIAVVDTSTNTVVQTVPNIPGATGLAYDSSRNRLWATSYNSNQLIPIQVNDEATTFTPLSPVPVGDGPWGVAYEPTRRYVYIANSLADSISVVADRGDTPEVVATLSGGFSRPLNVDVNPLNSKVYVANFGSHNVSVIKDAAISKIVDLYDSSQPYGLAVDEARELVYVSTSNSHRIVVIGPDKVKGSDQFYGWAAFYRGFGDRRRPLPLRQIVLNPEMGPAGDGGHVWAVTTAADGGEANQLLLIPKGWGGYFHYPLASSLGPDAAPDAGLVVDRSTNRIYVSNGVVPGKVTVWGDHADLCPDVAPASDQTGFDYDLFSVAALSQGDVTGDGRVDILDLAFIAANYGGANPAADVNGDLQVNIFDLVTAANNFGRQVR